MKHQSILQSLFAGDFSHYRDWFGNCQVRHWYAHVLYGFVQSLGGGFCCLYGVCHEQGPKFARPELSANQGWCDYVHHDNLCGLSYHVGTAG